MKSPMICSAEYMPAEHKAGYSELQVLQSAAGYYVGTMFWDDELKFWDPGSRDSDYFATEGEAKAYLDVLHEDDALIDPAVALRSHP